MVWGMKYPKAPAIQVKLGRNLVRLRKARYFTQEQVAELAQLHPAYVSSVERGERNVSIQNCAALAYALGVPLTALVDFTKDREAIPEGKVYKSLAKSTNASRTGSRQSSENEIG
jgi:transcriptional regulator with XRE-family HTH domain